MAEQRVAVADHVARVLRAVAPLASLEVGLLDAHGCVLVEDVVAPQPLPQVDLAALDGYAVRSSDVASPPVVLPVVGDSVPGPSGELRVQPGLAVRVAEGAVLPAGADAVVPLSWTDGGVAQVAVQHAPPPRGFVRAAGSDAPAGEVVLPAGTTVGPVQLALAAAVGRSRLHVRPRPRVVVLAAGAGLVEPGDPLSPGMLADAASPALTVAAQEAGAIPYRVGVVGDDARVLLDAVEDQLVRADAVILAGLRSGPSLEVVRGVLSRLGDVDLSLVAMDPGTRQAFGLVGPDRTPVFGLPVDPVGALVAFEVVVRPALRRMLGVEHLERPRVTAVAVHELRSPPGVTSFVRARLEVRDGAYVVAAVPQAPGGHALTSLSRANAFAVVPPEVERVAEGQPVEVLVLERRR